MKNKWGILVIAIMLVSCGGGEEPEFYPKPRGYMRLDFPERSYDRYQGDCSYSFEIPEYFEVIDKNGGCNKDVTINRFNATLFLTYIPVDTNLMMNIEYARKLVYDHSIKADEILEAVIINRDNKAYGVKYNIVGNAASPYQFYVTDSTEHFIRGALYFNVAPNYDSLKPSLDYIVQDIDHLIETVQWTILADSSNIED